jgi:hypothetical protein
MATTEEVITIGLKKRFSRGVCGIISRCTWTTSALSDSKIYIHQHAMTYSTLKISANKKTLELRLNRKNHR